MFKGQNKKEKIQNKKDQIQKSKGNKDLFFASLSNFPSFDNELIQINDNCYVAFWGIISN